MDILEQLNPQQRKAVTTPPGPTLVLAGPGSGKTRVLTHRIAYLVGHLGVPPRAILAVTFTNRAAREMKSRVEALLEGGLRGLTIGTFHSICARLLRREAQHLPVTPEFVIFDDSDQQALVKQVLKELNLNDKQYTPGKLLNKISAAKNELIDAEAYAASTYLDEIVKRVYTRYQQLLAVNNAFDFDDLLVQVVRLFDRQPDVLAKYQRYYEHLLVDEFQDTNTVQYTMLKQLAATHRNIYAVGDPDQCFPAGTLVQTPSGPRPIDLLLVGEEVLAASGRGTTMPARINHVEQTPYTGPVLSVQTASGHQFQATPNHIVFARLGRKPGLHYVYLMYRHDKGYRVGIASHARSDGVSAELQVGLKVRSNQEHADAVWVLRVCATREEARYWEDYFAFQYGVPTTVFHVSGRKMGVSQETINRLYRAIDTETNARRLLADLRMNERYPHYLPQGILRNVVNLRYFGDARRSLQSPWNAHRIDLWSSDAALRTSLQGQGYHARTVSRQNWRLGFSRLHYDDAQLTAQKLSAEMGGASIVVGAFLVDAPDKPLTPRFSLMPASHLHPSMLVASEHDGRIVEDEVVSVTEAHYQGHVYDLEVAGLHNYVAGGVVVHNSVYRWRGADYRNVRKFEEDYPDATVLLLEENYRSTQIILDAAMAVIDKHPGRTRKQLFTERQGGAQVHVQEAYNEQEEAQFVVDTVVELSKKRLFKPGDCAVMYRTNAQSRAVEEQFIRAGMPYRLVGAQRFYGRKEIKDLLAYLRLVHNPADSVSFMRVVNTPPRGIGAKTLEQIIAAADGAGVSSAALLRDLGLNGQQSPFAAQFTGKTGGTLVSLGKLLAEWHDSKEDLSVVQLLDLILDGVNYMDFVNDGSEEGQERWENVLELRNVAAASPDAGLTEFLEQVALVADQDTLGEEGEATTLLTLHAAKGLEFPVVFMVGLDEGVLPHQRSFEDPESMHEERRLMYVGMTRAKDRLYLVRAFRRSQYGDSGVADPSRFLEDIPAALMVGNMERQQSRAESYFKKATSWDTGGSPKTPTWETDRNASHPKAPTTQFRSGQRVRHAHFGDGIVISSKLIGGEEEVDVAFEAMGLKRLAASQANLQLLKG